MKSDTGRVDAVTESRGWKRALPSGLSFFIVLVSLSFRMLHWRVVNEPGAVDMPGLMFAHRLLFLFGAAGFSIFSIRFYAAGKGFWWRVPAAVGLALLAYLPFFGFTLVLMV